MSYLTNASSNNGPATLPLIALSRTWHCETDIDGDGVLRQSRMLCVTTTPHTRQSNAELSFFDEGIGENPDFVRERPWVELRNDAGRFVDVRAALADGSRRDALLAWAESNGLLQQADRFRGWFYDESAETWHDVVRETKELAWSAVDDGFYSGPDSFGGPQGRPCVEPVRLWVGTPALASAVGCEPVDGVEDDAIELAFRAYVGRECPDIDGLWWSSEINEFMGHPQGEILSARVAGWEAIPVDQAHRGTVSDEPYVPDAVEVPVGPTLGLAQGFDQTSRLRPRV